LAGEPGTGQDAEDADTERLSASALGWLAFDYWAVSDVSEAGLQAFKQAFEEQTARR
jgi:hypothetical protein